MWSCVWRLMRCRSVCVTRRRCGLISTVCPTLMTAQTRSVCGCGSARTSTPTRPRCATALSWPRAARSPRWSPRLVRHATGRSRSSLTGTAMSLSLLGALWGVPMRLRCAPRMVVLFPRASRCRLRVRSSDASLSFLDVGGLVLSPVFDPLVTLYTAEVSAGIDTVTAVAVAGDSDAVVELSPADADAGVGGHQVGLVAGGQTAVTVTVTAVDGSVRRYWVLISVPADTVLGSWRV